MQVRDVMSSPAVVVGPETPAKRAAALLDERGFTCLPVVDCDGKLVGAVSEADLLRDRFPLDPRIPLVERLERGEVMLGGEPADPVARSVALRAAEAVLGVTRCQFVS